MKKHKGFIFFIVVIIVFACFLIGFSVNAAIERDYITSYLKTSLGLSDFEAKNAYTHVTNIYLQGIVDSKKEAADAYIAVIKSGMIE